MESKRTELLTLNDLTKMLNISRSTIYRKLDPIGKHYDSSFPKSIKIGQKAVRWRLSDVEKWVDEQIHNNNETLPLPQSTKKLDFSSLENQPFRDRQHSKKT